MIRFNNVSYRFPDGTAAIKNIDVHIRKGERVAVVGSNGSGKSTFALLINGILKATTGSIQVSGLNPAKEEDDRRLKRLVGLVLQDPDNQLVSTTVEGEVAFYLENLNMAPAAMKAKVDNALNLFGLDKFRTRLTSELSGGEKQKLALAGVMVAEPEILILDEPESFLDESGRRLLDDTVSRLLKINKDLTVIRITQYTRVAEKYERMLVFDEGAIKVDGSPQSIFANLKEIGSIGIEAPLKFRLGLPEESAYWRSGALNKIRGKERNTRSIELESISFGYEEIRGSRLFDKLNLAIENDKIYGLVGPSGSGKTTLLQLMAGLLRPTSGKVVFRGFQPKPGAVAVSFQQSERQFFLETVEDELRFGARNLKVVEIDKVVGDCYRLIGIDKEKYASRNPFTLSGGEKRRLAFGAILSVNPAFVFFDEPTCALDSAGIRLFKEMAIRLYNDGVGIVIVSHYGDIILSLADRVIVMDEGRIEAVKDKEIFFRENDYKHYLSVPEVISYQLEVTGEIRHFSEAELIGRG
jgi:energy-coupling factor transporter ATP-binding protein EcfA2